LAHKKEAGEWVDQLLDIQLDAIFIEYRKEYTEFFISFFSSEDEIKDEVKLKLLDDYESLREMVSIQNVIEVRERMTSNFKINVRLKNSKGIVPIYNTICE
jgi:hypothetical protein